MMAASLERKVRPIKRKCEELFSVGREPNVAPFSHSKGTGISWWCHLMSNSNGMKELASVVGF